MLRWRHLLRLRERLPLHLPRLPLPLGCLTPVVVVS